MADDASAGSSEGDWGEFIGLPGAFSADALADVTDEEAEEGAAGAAGAAAAGTPAATVPLFSLLRVERLVLACDAAALEAELARCEARVAGDAGADADGIVQLQLEVLRMAVMVARGDFLDALASPAVAGLVAPEGTAEGETPQHSVSRVKGRIARFMHSRVVEHVERGLGGCVGRASFRDPQMASPEEHVNQRVLRAVSAMLLGAACLGLYQQANWTGPEVPAARLAPWYPLPFARKAYGAPADAAGAASEGNDGISRNGSSSISISSKTGYLEKNLSALAADAKAAGAVKGAEVRVVELDPLPELHAHCALMMGANGESVYRDARLLHMLHTARVILRVLTNPTITPSAVDPVDMLETAKLEDEESEQERNAPQNINAAVEEKVSANVRQALTHVMSSSWWVARAAAAHQETLESQAFGAPSLSQEAERGFARSLRIVQARASRIDGQGFDSNELVARLWLECGVARHKFTRPEQAKEAFRRAQEAAGLEVRLSGALGKRTRYQAEHKSQLVLLAGSVSTEVRRAELDAKAQLEAARAAAREAREAEAEARRAANRAAADAAIAAQAAAKQGQGPRPPSDREQIEAARLAPAAEPPEPHNPATDNAWGVEYGKDKVLGVRTVALEELDEHTPLRESVAFAEEERGSEAERLRVGSMSQLDQAIVLALCIDVKNSYAMESLTAEEMLAYVDRVTQTPDNWMIYSTGLLIKSQLEFERAKTKERAVLQMQVLVDQQSSRLTPLQTRQSEVDDSAPVHARLAWLHALAWPALWSLKRGLAQRYLELGVAGSALQIFEEVKLWEEAVDCLVLMERRARAESLVRERLAAQPTPNLMCVLGSLLNDAEWYSKSWDFSGQRFARAKRMWAVHCFSQGDMKASVAHLQEALKINPLYPGSWFRLGTAAMRLGDWQLARTAFANVTKQSPDDGDAWANLSTALVQLGDTPAALSAIAGAVRESRTNWKIWENYVQLAAEAAQWGMVVHGISNLVELRSARNNAKDEVDIRSLLLTVDALISHRDRLARAPEQGRATAGHDGGVSADTLASWRAQLEELFESIKQKCRSDPNVWKAMAIYYGAFADRANERDCLLRRVRALTQADAWERDEMKLDRVVNAVVDFDARFNAALAADAALADEAKRRAAAEARDVVRSTLNRVNAGPYAQEKAPALEALLD